MQLLNPSLFVILFGCLHSVSAATKDPLLLKGDSDPEYIQRLVESDVKVTTASKETDSHLRCQSACLFLKVLLHGKVSLPQSSIYEAQNAHWSQQQADVRSICRVTPTAAVDVSATLLTLKALRCQFAVKSGGHAAFVGASNIAEGVTIDTVNLNQVTVSADKKQVSVGPGNRWIDVYSKLDPLGISIVGGRVEDIGVGGLTLGGGISYFSGRFGFGSDNVNAYQVIFADGSINLVTYKSNPDLFWALRGGGNNFGIVTRFDFKAFPQGELWGGPSYLTVDKARDLFKALTSFAISAPSDPFATLWIAFVYNQASDMILAVPQLMYGKPVANPPIFDNFTALPSVGSDLKTTYLARHVAGSSGPYNFRQSYWTATFKNDAELQERILEIWQEEIEPLKTLAGWLPALIYQPLSVGLLEKSTANGGGPFGLSATDGPLILINIAFQWSDKANDNVVLAAARHFIDRANTEAKARGLDFPWIYQNYASKEQDVFGSYGPANHAKLRAISKKYDPTGVFQKLQPGYFKLW